MINKLFLNIRTLILTVFFISTTVLVNVDAYAITNDNGVMRDTTPLEIVKEMKVGWNLGNALDAIGGETKWGNPITTKAMIDEIKVQGFNTVRIPITWNSHIGSAPNYTIDKQWLDRVEEVVNYVRDNNMYAIINIHHDDDWIIPTYEHQAETTDKLTKVWEQVGNRFKNYSDYLIFETINEPRVKGSAEEWKGGTAKGRDVLNKYNLAAVNTIRSTGGNNASRFIMIPTYAASATTSAITDCVVPNDDSKVIVSLHMYSPYSFSMDENGTSIWGSDSDKSSIDSEFDKVYDKFVKNGRAVVIGEFGSIDKNNEEDRAALAQYYTKAARSRGITPIWWDNGSSFGIFNRNTLTWKNKKVADALVNSANEIK